MKCNLPARMMVTIAAGCWLLQSASAAAPAIAADTTVGRAVGMRLISPGVPVFASSGDAGRASDGNYTTYWRSSGLPAVLAYDLSSVATRSRQSILFVWYNDATYGYDHALFNAVGYNNPGSYSIDGNAADGGGAVPTNGWIALATVSNNTLHSRQHLLKFSGYNWIRFRAATSDGSPSNNDIVVKVDIYDAANGVTDGWLFAGDSITAGAMSHGNFSAGPRGSFGNQVNALTGVTPPQENAGVPNWTSNDMLAHLPDWLRSFPGKYVTINLGSNDAAGNPNAQAFYTNMAALINAVLKVGKIPVVPTIPWSRDATHAAHIPALNAQIRKLYGAYPALIPGPDLYAFFEKNQKFISADNLHPTEEGYAELRAQWATFAAESIYKQRPH